MCLPWSQMCLPWSHPPRRTLVSNVSALVSLTAADPGLVGVRLGRMSALVSNVSALVSPAKLPPSAPAGRPPRTDGGL